MPKPLTLLFIFIIAAVKAQQPAIGAMTILPQGVNANSQVTIVTNVTTPSQGVLVDKTFTVSQSSKRIELRLCYGSGMLPATQTFIDTFYVGQLGSGNFTVNLKAYMSSANQWCNKIDSNEVQYNLIVASPAGLTENDETSFKVYPNPVNEILHIASEEKYVSAFLYQLDGKLLSEFIVDENKTIMLEKLQPGLYIMKLSAGNNSKMIKILRH